MVREEVKRHVSKSLLVLSKEAPFSAFNRLPSVATPGEIPAFHGPRLSRVECDIDFFCFAHAAPSASELGWSVPSVLLLLLDQGRKKRPPVPPLSLSLSLV